ncbi:hypothetical protein LQ318_14695 [Aliifodinibius salicampi]|uniref:Uncharacterized protein n=1 Tax=Fodinibius salicampi TaxID=1920655 RepID=A0ABT3Q213_9BACT|nr:hypothetical protein [Fodinibius salicampi]MCW9714159.1 hypothetical protein [Fodinibius salicampi]
MIQGKRPDPQNEENFTQIRLMARGLKLCNMYKRYAKNLNGQQNKKSDIKDQETG